MENIDLPIDLTKIKTIEELVNVSRWLEGKTLHDIESSIKDEDRKSRVKTKGDVGYVVEHGFYGIEKNSNPGPDIPYFGVEIKTVPLKWINNKSLLTVKEPLSLNIINYEEESKNKKLTDSYLYKKNHKVLFVLYIHDKDKKRSDYMIKYVFLWKMDKRVISELEEDYQKILGKIMEGKAHEIHQKDNKYLTLCPKHNGHFNDPEDKKSKRRQPFSDVPAELRAFRFKKYYMELIVSKGLGKELIKKGRAYGWAP